MKISFKITAKLLAQIHHDLSHPHPFAAERIGFVQCQVAALHGKRLLILAHEFHPIEDADYLNDPAVGAMMGPAAIRKALQIAYAAPMCMFHVHRHDHRGDPWFSHIDLTENQKFVPDFWHVQPKFPHGAIVLSFDSMAGLAWIPSKRTPIRISEFSIVGSPMRFLGVRQ